MGCTPTKVNTAKLPATNAHPSKLVPTTSLGNIAASYSQIAPQDLDEIARLDIPVKSEKPTPSAIERIDFVNKVPITAQ